MDEYSVRSQDGFNYVAFHNIGWLVYCPVICHSLANAPPFWLGSTMLPPLVHRSSITIILHPLWLQQATACGLHRENPGRGRTGFYLARQGTCHIYAPCNIHPPHSDLHNLFLIRGCSYYRLLYARLYWLVTEHQQPKGSRRGRFIPSSNHAVEAAFPCYPRLSQEPFDLTGAFRPDKCLTNSALGTR